MRGSYYGWGVPSLSDLTPMFLTPRVQNNRAAVPPIGDVKAMSAHLAVRNPGHGRAILVREDRMGNQKHTLSANSQSSNPDRSSRN